MSYGFGTVKHRPLHIVYRFMAAFATSLQITFFPNNQKIIERIRQIEAKALRKLRHPSRSKKLKDFLN